MSLTIKEKKRLVKLLSKFIKIYKVLKRHELYLFKVYFGI